MTEIVTYGDLRSAIAEWLEKNKFTSAQITEFLERFDANMTHLLKQQS